MDYHDTKATQVLIDVIIPLAIPGTYTYSVPEPLVAAVRFGVRVEVQFGGQKHYTGVVVRLHSDPPEGSHRVKSILSVIDEQPIIYEQQYKLWRWMAAYYGCTVGEVMNAALPANLKLSSETRLVLSPVFDGDFTAFNDKEHLIAEALTIQEEISIADVRAILGQQNVYPLLRSLMDKAVIYLKEDLKERYQPKTVACVRWGAAYADGQSGKLGEAFDLLQKSERQTALLMAFVQLSKQSAHVKRKDLENTAKTDSGATRAVAEKGILEVYDMEVSRLREYKAASGQADELSAQQVRALAEIKALFLEKPAVLLHGVTGSGKTRVYVELIKETIARGGQVLYLLPEIALTTQIVSRLRQVFGNDIAVYHSRFNDNERVEIWHSAMLGKPIVLGARSAMLLPFQNLALVIIDEEHDPSFKQNEPNPHYHGRDAALFLAQEYGAKTLLGTATPSLESYHNAQSGKYGLVLMAERFGGLKMPEIVIVDAKAEHRKEALLSHFTTALIDELKAALANGEQAILFQNRRGYAPTYRCNSCGWHSECIHCDVSLTYHKLHQYLKCHYCGYQTKPPSTCPTCGSKQLSLVGFGTEKVEDELKIYLPEARIARMDFDTVRTKNAHANIINDFEERRIDILVGTQMVTKGLDFDNVGVVGVLSADQLLQFPDFRSSERAYQMMVQVSGRAGRKNKQGKVIIQAFNVAHPVLGEVVQYDYKAMYQREIAEREAFGYPPFTKLIKITLRHKSPETVNDGARIFGAYLKKQLGEWVIGPALPQVARVRGQFLLDFMIKMPRHASKMTYAKNVVQEATIHLQQQKGFSGVRVSVDVDPY